jgi:predicted ester cyclase
MSTPDAAELWLAYNDAENRSDFEAMAQLVAPDLAVTVNGRPSLGSAEDDERVMRLTLDRYPDYHREVEEMIGAGARAVARWRMLGTPTSTVVPLLEVHGCSVIRAEHGVMTEAHLYYDAGVLDSLVDLVNIAPGEESS